jgi:predicted transcriptional regulator
MKKAETKKVMSVKLAESLIKKVEKEATKQKRTVHYLMCEAIERSFK